MRRHPLPTALRRTAVVVALLTPTQSVVRAAMSLMSRRGFASSPDPSTWRLPLSANSRARSTASLVELYFSLVAGLEIALHLEIGAKDAQASRRAVALPHVRVAVAFEANPSTHRRFASELAMARVDYLHLAAGDRDGTATLYVRRRNRKTVANGKASLVAYGMKRRRAVEVPIRSLDGVLRERLSDGSQMRAALWIDVEGAQAPVLRGAGSTLDDTDVLIVEVESRELFDGQEWLAPDVVGHLASAGFMPIARDAQSRYQFNMVFVKRDLAGTQTVRHCLGQWRRELVSARFAPH